MAQVSLEGLTLHVADLERSLAFYNRLPGAVVEFHKPGLFAMVRIGRGRLGLLQRAAGRFHVELEVDDLDGFYDEVRQAGIEPKGPPVRHPWGERDFQVVDPDGFVLEFEAGSDDAPSGPADYA
jgi:catechol 2,3-dioxygenase-like lactoylglutathione lyase family enzyme